MIHQLEELERADELISSVEKRLEDYADKDPLCVWLMQLRGVGLVTATMIRSEIGTATRFRNGKQLARFCGLTPRNASSGERQADSGLIRAGNPQLKKVLIQVAHVLLRNDAHWRAFAQRLSAQGKPYCVCLAAIANRWLRRLYHQMRSFELGGDLPLAA